MNYAADLPPIDAERLARLRLARSEHVGPITFKKLLSRYGSARAALAALPELALRGGLRRTLKIASEQQGLNEFQAHAQQHCALLIWGDEGYPKPLAEISDPPMVLSCKGNPDLLTRPMVAIVGARNASLNGRRFAEKLAEELSQAGYVVVSGLARGIDGAAHQGALSSGTIGVVGGGVDIIYPPEHQNLFEQLGAQGLIVSEHSLGTAPQSGFFPRRNRIISGLCQGVVVVEAAMRSGSLITARLANEQGREVFAVPGSPMDPRAQGCNHLIRDGAHLIESANDVIDHLRERLGSYRPPETLWDHFHEPEALPMDSDQLRANILNLLSPSPISIDDLLRECQFSASSVQLILLELELAGRISRMPGNQVALRVA
ncbi:MAG: DNA-processing protein DprA [Holosporales bacterium]